MTSRHAPAWCRWQDGDLVLRVRVQPKAKKDELVGTDGERLRLRIAAPPIEGEANERLQRFLAGVFGVPRSRVELLGGVRSREKRLLIRRPERLPELVPPR